MTKTLNVKGFKNLNSKSLSELNGGIVFTSAFVGACVIWAVNAAVLTYALRDVYED